MFAFIACGCLNLEVTHVISTGRGSQKDGPNFKAGNRDSTSQSL